MNIQLGCVFYFLNNKSMFTVSTGFRKSCSSKGLLSYVFHLLNLSLPNSKEKST